MKSFWRSFFFIHVALLVLVMSWEQGKNDPAFAASIAEGSSNAIPQESIRLRILADSDSPSDQLLKRRIRDEVIVAMNGWVTGPQTIEEARETVRAHLPELDRLVGSMVLEAGYSYPHKVELGFVPFPTKVYGDRVYPAGNYEALRITLGRGLGQNWWCVLFPPLCFVDVSIGEAPKKAKDAQGERKIKVAKETANGTEDGSAVAMAAFAGSAHEVEYRFFLADWFSDLKETVEHWFA
jgi:stage II sporulation protein R